MKKIFFVLAFSFFVFNFANAQWFTQASFPNIYFYDIDFLNINTGYAVGGFYSSPATSQVYKTTNGGNNWICILNSSAHAGPLWKMSFVNENTGFCCGYTGLHKTTDGGQNWIFYDLPRYLNTVTQNYSGIKFFNENTGYLGGRYGMMIKTTDGGQNWISLDTADNDVTSIYFLDIVTGYMSVMGSKILKTTNGGSNWNVYTNVSSFTEMIFTDYYVGYGTFGFLYKTINGGITWNPVTNTDIGAYSICAVNDSLFYVGSESYSKIFKTTNRGINWLSQNLPSSYRPVEGVHFINSNTGYCCSYQTIMKTTNGGAVSINNISSEIPNRYKLHQNYPNPFNPTTNIKYQIQKSGFVTLKVYDILGKEIATLVNEIQKPGTYEVPFSAENLNSGVYFYKIQSGNYSETKRMILIK